MKFNAWHEEFTYEIVTSTRCKRLKIDENVFITNSMFYFYNLTWMVSSLWGLVGYVILYGRL